MNQAISVISPTYRREHVLVDKIRYLHALRPPPGEIVIVDQSEQLEPSTSEALQAMGDAS